MNTPRPRSFVSGTQTRERGFTLIEVMVAALLLLILLAGFVPVLLGGLGSATRERYRSLATNLAQERIEQIRQLDYREIGTASELTARFAPDNGNDPVVRGATFHITYATEDYTPTGASQPLKKVTVTVTWDTPPALSPIVVSTMIDQMFLGPRGSWLEIAPTHPITGSPFAQVTGAVTVKYHVAQADWGLVLNNVADPAAGVQNVYMRLAFVDDYGVTVAAGDVANDNKIDKTHVGYTTANGVVNDVFFSWDISKIDDFYGQNPPNSSPGLLPDAYWETQAAIYNAYDQPGNMWRLRVRVMGDVPGTPQLVATPVQTADGWNQVVLNWMPGAERDRDHFVLTRTGSGSPMPPLTLGKLVTAYTDTGDVSTPVDPWGDGTHTNNYTYAIYAVDSESLQGADGTVSVEMPPTTVVGGTTTTTVAPTTTTTVGGATTTTTLTQSVQLVNNTNQDWTVTITNESNVQVWSGTLARNTILTPSVVLAPGNYSISGSGQGNHTISASFSMPDQAGLIVLIIS